MKTRVLERAKSNLLLLCTSIVTVKNMVLNSYYTIIKNYKTREKRITMETKILFTDLDGTLLNSEKTISEKTHQKIMEMLNRGHKFVLSSGRSLDNLKEVREKLNLPKEGVYISAYQGASLYDCSTDTLLIENRLNLDTAQAIFSEVIKAGLYCHTYNGPMMITTSEGREIDYYRRHIPFPYVITNDIREHLTEGPHKILIINLEDRKITDDFRTKIMNMPYGNEIQSAYSSPVFLEFYSKDAGKGNGLRTLCNMLNIPVENSYACGDEENDVTMLQAAGTGIAMQNATPIAKEAADIVTVADNDHDAIAEVIDRFFL